MPSDPVLCLVPRIQFEELAKQGIMLKQVPSTIEFFNDPGTSELLRFKSIQGQTTELKCGPGEDPSPCSVMYDMVFDDVTEQMTLNPRCTGPCADPSICQIVEMGLNIRCGCVMPEDPL